MSQVKKLDQHGNKERGAESQDDDVLNKLEILPQCRVATPSSSGPRLIIQFVFDGHYNQPARGLKLDTRLSSSNRRRSSALTSLGTTIFNRTYSSPRPPRRLFNPCPRKRSRCPLCAPEGTVTSTCPSIVGTSMRAPSTASHGAIGLSTSTSSPRTVNTGCGRTRMCRYRSPDGASFAPLPPCPARRTIAPSRTPAGILTSSVLTLGTWPKPPHVWQTWLSFTTPDTLHVGQISAA